MGQKFEESVNLLRFVSKPTVFDDLDCRAHICPNFPEFFLVCPDFGSLS